MLNADARRLIGAVPLGGSIMWADIELSEDYASWHWVVGCVIWMGSLRWERLPDIVKIPEHRTAPCKRS